MIFNAIDQLRFELSWECETRGRNIILYVCELRLGVKYIGVLIIKSVCSMRDLRLWELWC